MQGPPVSTYQDEKPISPDRQLGEKVGRLAKADLSLCWTCGSCDAECPINQATQGLRPRRILRMASLGLMEELLGLPDIWYCITCNRCSQICPTLAKPSRVIGYLREEVSRTGKVRAEILVRYSALFSRFQRVRWRVASHCLTDEFHFRSEDQWVEALHTPLDANTSLIYEKDLFGGSPAFKAAAMKGEASACFTCGECTVACPLRGERSVFDPQWIVRMAHLGLSAELLCSPSLWLCIGCRRCTEGCSQAVKPHAVIETLRQIALDEGFVDRDFTRRFQEASKELYRLFVKQVDGLLGAGG